MNRRKTASVWALVLGGVLLALPAAAAEKNADTCSFDCEKKASSQVETCSQACPSAKDATKREAAIKCMTKCADKLHAAMASCKASCPAPKKPSIPQTP